MGLFGRYWVAEMFILVGLVIFVVVYLTSRR